MMPRHPSAKVVHLSGAFVVGGLLIAGVAIWRMVSGGLNVADYQANDQDSQLAANAVERYVIAEKTGEAMAMCVEAGQVAAGFLRAKNGPEYRKWQDVEKIDFRRAGVPKR